MTSSKRQTVTILSGSGTPTKRDFLSASTGHRLYDPTRSTSYNNNNNGRNRAQSVTVRPFSCIHVCRPPSPIEEVPPIIVTPP